MRRPGRVLAAASLVVALAACGGGAQDPEPTPGPDLAEPTADASEPSDDPVATVTVPAGGAEIELAVHPLVRAGEHVVLTLDATLRGLPDGGRLLLANVLGRVNTSILPMEAPLPVRLLDLGRGVIMHGGTGADGAPVVAPEDWSRIDTSTGTRLQMAFAAPPAGTTSLALLVPGAPLVAPVPVVDGDVPPSVRPGGDETSDGARPIDLDAVTDAHVFPLESTSRELDGAVQTTESTEMVEVTLGSDVLFEFDSAELTEQADAAVALVAERILAREPGDVTVVGHTDDQGDGAYNQDLSERRAGTVAEALAGHLDAGTHTLQAEGRGETEPFVPNSSEENRALNRRVTVTLASAVVTRTDITTTGELPPWEGAEGTAGAPLRLEPPGGVWELEATARRLDGHVVVELAVTAEDAGSTTFLRSLSSHRGEGTTTPHSSSAGLTVLHGATRLHPLDYRAGESPQWPGGEWLTAADLVANVGVEAGQTYVFTYVYPRLDVETVTVQLGATGRDAKDFRIVDVPVRE